MHDSLNLLKNKLKTLASTRNKPLLCYMHFLINFAPTLQLSYCTVYCTYTIVRVLYCTVSIFYHLTLTNVIFSFLFQLQYFFILIIQHPELSNEYICLLFLGFIIDIFPWRCCTTCFLLIIKINKNRGDILAQKCSILVHNANFATKNPKFLFKKFLSICFFSIFENKRLV